MRTTRLAIYLSLILVSLALAGIGGEEIGAAGKETDAAGVEAGAAGEEAGAGRVVHVITIDTSINPGSSDFIMTAIDKATAEGAAALVIELNTPGGLVDSTQDIVAKMLEAEIPVFVYVTPAGAHAGSAGVMITLAGHVAAMAPTTRIGAASPVSMTGEMDETMKSKVTNDIAGFVESIAKKRGRNVDLAIETVTEAAVLTDDEALEEDLIDLIAKDLEDLLAQADGRTVVLGHDKEVTLHVAGARIERRAMSLKQIIVSALADPNLVYLFMIIGMLGLYTEFSHPGMIFPGVIGGIALILFAVSTQILPINVVGLLFIAAGIALFVLEFKFTSYGFLTVMGVALIVLGSLFMFDFTRDPQIVYPEKEFTMGVSWGLVLPTAIFMGLFSLFIAYKVVRAHVGRKQTGFEGLVGETGKAVTAITGEGKVKLQGIFWDAAADEPIEAGAKVEVVEASSLKIKVKKLK